MKPKPQPSPATRAILKQIVKFINDHKDGAQLYNIITALRGPDSENYSLKSCTTAVLRRAIGLPGEGKSGVGYDSYADQRDFAESRRSIFASLENGDDDARKEHHFLHHVRVAFESAGLRLDKVNLPKAKKVVRKAKRARK